MQIHRQPLALRACAKITRHERALIVRSRVLAWLPGNSRFEEISDAAKTYSLRPLHAKIGTFSISHHTPFSGTFPGPTIASHHDAVFWQSCAKKRLGYGLDVWHVERGKVMNLVWGHAGQSELVSFAKGDWDADLLAMLNQASYRQ